MICRWNEGALLKPKLELEEKEDNAEITIEEVVDKYKEKDENDKKKIKEEQNNGTTPKAYLNRKRKRRFKEAEEEKEEDQNVNEEVIKEHKQKGKTKRNVDKDSEDDEERVKVEIVEEHRGRKTWTIKMANVKLEHVKDFKRRRTRMDDHNEEMVEEIDKELNEEESHQNGIVEEDIDDDSVNKNIETLDENDSQNAETNDAYITVFHDHSDDEVKEIPSDDEGDKDRFVEEYDVVQQSHPRDTDIEKELLHEDLKNMVKVVAEEEKSKEEEKEELLARLKDMFRVTGEKLINQYDVYKPAVEAMVSSFEGMKSQSALLAAFHAFGKKGTAHASNETWIALPAVSEVGYTLLDDNVVYNMVVGENDELQVEGHV